MTDYQRVYMDAYTKSSANASGRGSVAAGIQTVAATAYRDGEAAGYRDGEQAGLREGERAGIELAAAIADEVAGAEAPDFRPGYSERAHAVAVRIRDRIRAELACPDCKGSGVVDDPENTGCYGCVQGGVHESWCGLSPCPRGCPIPAPAGTEAAK